MDKEYKTYLEETETIDYPQYFTQHKVEHSMKLTMLGTGNALVTECYRTLTLNPHCGILKL